MRLRGQASPFIFDGPLPPDEVVGRSEELAALLDRAHHGRFTLLYAPRRYGKTSLIHRLAHEAQTTRDLTVIFIDLDGIQTIDDITRRFQDAYRQLPRTAIGKAVTAGLAALSRIEVRAGGTKLSVRPPSADQATPVLERLLDLPAEAARKTGVRVLVVLDEFQAIAPITGADAVLRSRIQHQRDRVSYLFSGSEQGLLNAVFADTSRPLYGQAEQLVLGPLPNEAIVDLVTAKFASTNRDAAAALEPLVAASQGHPQRASFLADCLWHTTPDGAAATTETWIEAQDRALRAAQPEFIAIDHGLTPVQRKVVRLLAHNEPIYGAAARKLGLAKSSATDALAALRQRSLVSAAADETPPQLIDPLFALWTVSRYER